MQQQFIDTLPSSAGRNSSKIWSTWLRFSTNEWNKQEASSRDIATNCRPASIGSHRRASKPNNGITIGPPKLNSLPLSHGITKKVGELKLIDSLITQVWCRPLNTLRRGRGTFPAIILMNVKQNTFSSQAAICVSPCMFPVTRSCEFDAGVVPPLWLLFNESFSVWLLAVRFVTL